MGRAVRNAFPRGADSGRRSAFSLAVAGAADKGKMEPTVAVTELPRKVLRLTPDFCSALFDTGDAP